MLGDTVFAASTGGYCNRIRCLVPRLLHLMQKHLMRIMPVRSYLQCVQP